METNESRHDGYSAATEAPRWWHWARVVNLLGIQFCILYLVVIYLLPLTGLIRQPLVPLKALVELVACAVPISTGVLMAGTRALTESVLFSLEEEFYVVRIGPRTIAVCCLEMMSVPGSVEQDGTDRPRYNATMLLALRAGMDKRVTIAYEVGLTGEEPFLRMFISTTGHCLVEMEDILKNEATRVEAILLASLNNVELRQLRGEALTVAATSILGKATSGNCRMEKSSCRSAMVFSGNPRIAPSAFTSQIGTFLSTALKQGYIVSLTCVFSAAKAGRRKRKLEGEWRSIREREKKREDTLEDQATKRDLLNQYDKIQGDEGWFDASVYILMAAEDLTRLKAVEEGVKGLTFSIWGGEDRISVVERDIGNKLECRVLARRHLRRQRMHASRLAAFINTPVQSIPVVTAAQIPDFRVPARELLDNELCIGWTVYGGHLLSRVGLKKEWLREHVAVLGATGTGKTSLVKHLIAELSLKTDVPWWIFDVKGSEYSDLAEVGKHEVMILRPGLDPSFIIDLMDPEADNEERQAHATFVILRELLKEMGPSNELSPAMEKLLRDAIFDVVKSPSHGDSVVALTETISRLVDDDRIGHMTRDALLNRLQILLRQPLGSILGGGSDAIKMSTLLGKRVVFDLRYVARVGGMDAARLLYNLVAKRIFDSAMRRGITPGLSHVVVLEEANNLVPESYTRQTAADVTTGESMVMLQRATGQGVIVVSTRPDISSNILANTATKITFRLPYDSSVGARFMSLNEEQEKYLRMLRVGRALIVTPGTDTFELATVPFGESPQFEHRIIERQAQKEHLRPESLVSEQTCVDVQPPSLSESSLEIETDGSTRSIATAGHRTTVFDGLGELANRVVAFLASRSMATKRELCSLLAKFNPQIGEEDLSELIQELVSLGTIERESLPLVEGGVLFALPGRGCDAVTEVIGGYIAQRLEVSIGSSGNASFDGQVMTVEDKAILIVPEYLRVSSTESILERIRHQMSMMRNDVTELFVIVRGSVAATRLRELMDADEEYDAVSVVSAFPSSLDKMVESRFQKGESETVQESATSALKVVAKADDIALKEEKPEEYPRTVSPMHLRLWSGVIQDFVDISKGQAKWNTLLDFIETTSLQSVKGRSVPMNTNEGRQALTELIADGKLIALRVRKSGVFPCLEEGLWVVGPSVVRDLKKIALEALETQLRKLNEPIVKGHGYYDLCGGGRSYVVFPSQEQLNMLLRLDVGLACKACMSTQAICVLPATEYLDDEMARPRNLQICELEELCNMIVRSKK